MTDHNVVARDFAIDCTARIPTGLRPLNDLLQGGYDRGSLVVLAAPRAAGKSILAMSTGIGQYLEGNLTVQYWSLELTSSQFWTRALSNISHTPYREVRLRHQDPAVADRLASAQQGFLHHGEQHGCEFSAVDVQDPKFTPGYLEEIMTTSTRHPDVVIVDSAGMFYHESTIQEIHRYFKVMAKRINGVVVLVHQDNRDHHVIPDYCDYLVKWPGLPLPNRDRTVEMTLAKSFHSVPREFNVTFDVEHMQVT
jgi:archaellum biogenesis ATPase FlaH